MQSSSARTGLLIVFCLLASSLISTASAQIVNAGTTAEPAPILPDDEFEERLPSLDADASTAGPARATAEDPPAFAEPLPPVDDELSAPLTPLPVFDVTPAPAGTQQAASDQPPAVSYRLLVEGFEGTGLGDRFRDLSALEDGDGSAETAAMIEARAQADEELALRLLHSRGYFDASVTSAMERPSGPRNEPMRAVITVTPGKQYALGDIAIRSPPVQPPGLIRDALPLETGNPIIAERVLAAEANISLILPQQGYPFVELGDRDIALDPAILTGDYTLPVEPGPRGSFGDIVTEGDLAFGADHVATIARFDEGELYDSRKVDDLRKALVATNLFSSIGVQPVQTGRKAPDGTEYVDLRVLQEAGPTRTLAADAGYGTGQGFRVGGSWTHRNLFPPEGALILGAVAGTQEQGLSATFRRSNAGRRDRTVQAGLELLHEDYKSYSAYTAALRGSISRSSTPIFQKRWTWSYGFELLASDQTTVNETTGDTKRLTYLIGALPGELGYDTSDDLLDPRNGLRARLRLSPEASLQGGVTPYVRGTLDLSGYYGVSDDLVIAARTRLGSIIGSDRADIAPSRRLYAGGGGSVRGFGYHELGPRDIDNDPLGGRSVNEFALEARYRFGNFGIVPFVDAGQVYRSSYPQFSDIRFGVGIGGRYYTNFGPVRVDVAVPINRRPGESRYTLYIGIGQAF